ncbi:MAG: DsbA family protein [Candidatus Gastranaerophilales bacterium]|nr:DsbA family protein [Candidatus Gastranaerophilales bacterium]
MKRETILTILSIVGILITIKLAVIYYQANYNPYAVPSFCSINNFVDCDGVAETSKALFLGIPLAYWGMFLYSFIIMLLNVDKIQKIKGLSMLSVFKHPLSYISALGLIAFIISIILALTSVFILHKICLLCFVTYVLNAGIAIAATDFNDDGFKKSFRQSFEDFNSRIKEQTIPFIIAIVIASIFLSYTTFAMPFASRKQSIKHYLLMKHNPYKISGNILGNKNGKIVADVYTDFVCPICYTYNIMLHKLVKEQDNIYIKHHNLPLDTECNPYLETQMHKGACRMAKYAIAAENQGKYWDMANALFENQPPNDKEAAKLAQTLNLDIDKFTRDINSSETKKRLQEEIDTAIGMGIDGTPTLIVNDRRYNGAKPYFELKRIILGR